LVLADGVAPFATPVFTAAAAGHSLTLLEAWVGALAYTLQLYFDFSAYSDMAIGLSRMFGIKLPLNFNSPYKAANIVDFWRRWHMTLSRFLRDYLYFTLGGNRKGTIRRYINLMVTMLLGGLWHGAGWTFIIWGGLHGLYLCIKSRLDQVTYIGARRLPCRHSGARHSLAAHLCCRGGRLGVFPCKRHLFGPVDFAGNGWRHGLLIPSNWPGAWYLHAVFIN